MPLCSTTADTAEGTIVFSLDNNYTVGQVKKRKIILCFLKFVKTIGINSMIFDIIIALIPYHSTVRYSGRR